MKNFSIDNDRETLVSFIKNALKYNSALKVWASPWSPPAWLKFSIHDIVPLHNMQAQNKLTLHFVPYYGLEKEEMTCFAFFTED